MLPVLINLPFLKIYTFGIFLLLAFFWGSFMLWKSFLLTSYKEEDIFDGLFASLLGALFFSRLVYVGLHFDQFGFNVAKFLLINGYPGLSLYGFIAGGFLSFYLFSLSKKIRFSESVDYIIPATFLSLGFGKLGAFLSGAEIGAKTTLPVGLRYAGVDGIRHMTSLYEGLLFFLAAFIAYKLMFSIRREKYAKGFNLAFFGLYFSLVYLAFDFLKTGQVKFFGFSFHFIISACLLLTFVIYFLYYFKGSIFSFFGHLFRKKHGKKTGKIHHQKVQHES